MQIYCVLPNCTFPFAPLFSNIDRELDGSMYSTLKLFKLFVHTNCPIDLACHPKQLRIIFGNYNVLNWVKAYEMSRNQGRRQGKVTQIRNDPADRETETDRQTYRHTYTLCPIKKTHQKTFQKSS